MMPNAQNSLSNQSESTRSVLTQLLDLSDALFDPRGFDGQKLNESLPRLALQCVPLARAPQMEHETYGRHVIWSTPGSEIMLASWRPGGHCAPHDHGHSLGMVLVLDGQFTETSYQLTGDRMGLRAVGTQRITRPQLMNVQGGDVHDMHCTGPHGGLTLHFYRPAIRAMKVYDREERRTYTVSEDCGAWRPLSRQILRIENWAADELS